MANGEDWLMRPVSRGYCRFESLVDGTLTLNDVADMNESIDVQEFNKYQAAKAARGARG